MVQVAVDLESGCVGWFLKVAPNRLSVMVEEY